MVSVGSLEKSGVTLAMTLPLVLVETASRVAVLISEAMTSCQSMSYAVDQPTFSMVGLVHDRSRRRGRAGP